MMRMAEPRCFRAIFGAAIEVELRDGQSFD